jgi:hypothetical protein
LANHPWRTILGEPLDLPPSRIEDPASETLTPLCELRDSVVKPSQPRSKIARLPADIQTNLNTLLATGCRYRDIIHSLKAQGYLGFNKVNLHDWKKTGFQHWLRDGRRQAILRSRAHGFRNR